MAKFIPVDIFDLVIFGGAGDLALRKLMPALYHRDLDGQLPAGSRIISVGRRPMGRDDFLQKVGGSLKERLCATEYSAELWESFSRRLQYVATDAMAQDRKVRVRATGKVSRVLKFAGIDRLVELARTLRERPAREIVEGVLADVERFSAEAPPQDDRTVLVLRYPG